MSMSFGYGPAGDKQEMISLPRGNRDQKFGFDCEGGKQGGLNSRPEHIKQVVEGSLRRLRSWGSAWLLAQKPWIVPIPDSTPHDATTNDDQCLIS
jgi:hypothetical protein